MFQLLGDNAEVAAAKAATVMKIETALAKGHLDVVTRRDPNKLDHVMSVKQLADLAPSINWGEYLPAVGANQPTLNRRRPGVLQNSRSGDQRHQPR